MQLTFIQGRAVFQIHVLKINMWNTKHSFYFKAFEKNLANAAESPQ